MSYRSRPADAVFAAVADPTRRAIVERVARQRLTAGELARGFRNISRPAVAKHVRILREAGLLRQTREGRHRLYELDAAPLRVLEDWVAQYRDFWQSNLRSLKRYVEHT